MWRTVVIVLGILWLAFLGDRLSPPRTELTQESLPHSAAMNYHNHGLTNERLAANFEQAEQVDCCEEREDEEWSPPDSNEGDSALFAWHSSSKLYLAEGVEWQGLYVLLSSRHLRC